MTKQPDYGSIENRVVVASFDEALLGIYHGHSVLVEIAQSPIPHPTQAHPGAPRVRYESPSAIEWAMSGRDTGGFVDSQSKNAAGWWSGWSGAQRRRSKPKFLRFSRTPTPCELLRVRRIKGLMPPSHGRSRRRKKSIDEPGR